MLPHVFTQPDGRHLLGHPPLDMNFHKNSVQPLPYPNHGNPSSLNDLALLVVVVIAPSRLDLPGRHALGKGQDPEPPGVPPRDVADVVLTNLCSSLFLLFGLATFDHFETLHASDLALGALPALEFGSGVRGACDIVALVLESKRPTPLLHPTLLLPLLVLTYKWLGR